MSQNMFISYKTHNKNYRKTTHFYSSNNKTTTHNRNIIQSTELHTFEVFLRALHLNSSLCPDYNARYHHVQ